MVNCPNCGTSNLDNAAICINCGRSLAPVAEQSYTPPPPSSSPSSYGAAPAVGPAIPNYLWQSIVVTLCCCLPLGVVGIIFAAQVNTKLAQGDIAGAQEASRKAKLFTMIGLVVGLVVIVIWFAVSGLTMMQAWREASANR